MEICEFRGFLTVEEGAHQFSLIFRAKARQKFPLIRFDLSPPRAKTARAGIYIYNAK
jgi:hypothetical protein